MAGHDYKDWPQTSSQCHSYGQEPFGCSTVRQATSLVLRVYRHIDGYSLKGWQLWKRSGTPAVGVPSLAQHSEGNPFVSFSWISSLSRHIPPSIVNVVVVDSHSVSIIYSYVVSQCFSPNHSLVSCL